jgi:hypothetical protein
LRYVLPPSTQQQQPLTTQINIKFQSSPSHRLARVSHVHIIIYSMFFWDVNYLYNPHTHSIIIISCVCSEYVDICQK